MAVKMVNEVYWHILKTKEWYCVASSIVIGTVLEVNGKVVEDASWLRKKDVFRHKNV